MRYIYILGKDRFLREEIHNLLFEDFFDKTFSRKRDAISHKHYMY